MRRECDLAEGVADVADLPEDKLPFGEWMRASPMKKATVSVDDHKKQGDNTSLRRQLFDNFRQKLNMDRESKGEEEMEGVDIIITENWEVEDVRAHWKW
ncbi:hypothetical protein ACS0TY_029076 [Phlomoides rotata]